MLGGLAVAWGLRLAGVIANWPMVILFGVVVVAALVAVRVRGGPTVFVDAARQAMTDATAATPVDHHRGGAARESRSRSSGSASRCPWTADRVAEVDRQLGVDRRRVPSR